MNIDKNKYLRKEPILISVIIPVYKTEKHIHRCIESILGQTYPSLILLNKVESLFELALGFISPLVGVVMLLISLWVFKQGLKRYAGAGN